MSYDEKNKFAVNVQKSIAVFILSSWGFAFLCMAYYGIRWAIENP